MCAGKWLVRCRVRHRTFQNSIHETRKTNNECIASRCRGSHDLPAYIASKPSDLYWTPAPVLLNSSPFVAPRLYPPQTTYEEFPSIDVSTICPYYGEHGRCKYGFKCRFLGGHVERGEGGTLVLLTDPEREATAAITAVEKNSIEMSVLKSLRKKEVGVPSHPMDLKPTTLFFQVSSTPSKRL
jgi:hypothetical protein